MPKQVSLDECTGTTRQFYMLIRENLYWQNYKDAPALRQVQTALLGVLIVTIDWQVRWLLG